MIKNDVSRLGKISPSQFMRGLRPEYYSDTEDQVAYLLEALTLEYHLESITQRNQTHDFEIFCRKLCERVICPNLRPQTGPEGGGDSKADTETYPIADEIAALTYVGEANGGRERWAFAFSAKKSWTKKVRDDVKGIIETERKYDRIICITSRFARAKDRARIEDELSKQYGTPVTIHDRSWIVKEIIENDRKDIAFNYLRVGEAKSDPLRLGPTDYSRTQQLADIERSIDDPEAFRGMERQQVTEALVAAKLSRNLERPRTETVGRFLRAIRLADADGTYRQMLEAKYEHIWTAFWWFDNFQFLKDSYESFETLALESDHAANLEFLCNLLQLLVNSVIHGHMSRDECRLDERTARLKMALEQIAGDKDRPNNSLEAQTSLLIIRMNQVVIDGKHDGFTDIWHDFAAILEKASGLSEFKVERLVSIVEMAGQLAGNDPAYNDLVEKMAEFVANRKSEAEGALILLKRAQKLDFSDNLDMIRFLGKAAIGLTKKEYYDHLIDALQLLMLSYRSAGMLWAARASCIFLAASLVIESEEESLLPVSFVPTMSIWAWLALELRHLPDFLFAIHLLNGALTNLPLADDTKTKVRDDLQQLDAALGSLFLNLDETDLRKLAKVPDVLDALGLFMARSALLFILGHADVLRADCSIPVTESDEEVNWFFSMLASQPVAKNLRGPITLNAESPHTLSTSILGMTIEINIEGSLQSILVAEAVLGSLEAFFATAIEKRVMPHTEKLRINLIESDQISKPSFVINRMDMVGVLMWPRALSPTSYEQQEDVQKILAEVSGHVLIISCVAENIESLFKTLYEDEAVHHRMNMVAVASTSYHRVASKYASRIDDWQERMKKSYELLTIRPTLALVEFKDEDVVETNDGEGRRDKLPELKDHRALSVRSIIDVHAWDQARWRGTLYAQFSPTKPPCVALIFENEEGARKIFQHWRERFGTHDKNDEISLSIIRHLPQQNKHHYCILITSKHPEDKNSNPNQMIVMATRSMVMEPESDVNLERFLESYHHFGAFYLLPALLNDTGTPKLLFELAILKKNLTVKLAADIGERDIEAITLRRF
ncbi:MAG: tetratricopeptide repeat protein [Syntrophales bacterium]